MRRTRCFVLLACSAVLALPAISPALAGEVCKAPKARLLADPPLWCNAWVVTNYYSDATLSTQVGQCSITCAQYDQTLDEPVFGGGGTCTGTSSAYTKDLTTICRCQP
jgi:hypothetical protein